MSSGLSRYVQQFFEHFIIFQKGSGGVLAKNPSDFGENPSPRGSNWADLDQFGSFWEGHFIGRGYTLTKF